MFSHLYDMISVIRFHHKFLLELENQGVPPTPENLKKLMYSLDKNWNMTPDELVRFTFNLTQKNEINKKFKIKIERKFFLLIVEFNRFKCIRFIKF